MTVFIHIGAPKTGTTTIQTAMYRNATRLRREYSVNYPTIQSNHWPVILPYTTEDRFPPLTNHVLRRSGTRQSFARKARKFARTLRRDANRCRTHVISSEMLLIADRDAIAGLRGLFDGLGLETKILLYVRHPAERVSSLVSQNLRNGLADLDTFPITDNITPALRNFAEVFGRDNIIIRRFGPRYFVNGDLLDDFTTVVHGEPIRGLEAERLNDALSVPAAILADHLYKTTPLTSGNRSRDDFLGLVDGPRFKAPRWMVEKTMEVNREGLDYLASEFGIEFHQVDLSQFPEEIERRFPPEAMRSLARILNDQSVRIEELSARLRRRPLRQKLRDGLGILGRN